MRTEPCSRDRYGVAPDTVHAGRPVRMLIVDDHEVSRAALRALLRTEGYDVIDVRASDEAITVASTFRPGVAIIDVTPGRPAGFRVASQLRQLAHAPAILLTSS